MYTKSLSAIYDLDFCSALLAHFLCFCPFDCCRHLLLVHWECHMTTDCLKYYCENQAVVVFLKSNMRSNEVSPSGILKYTRRSRVYFRMPRGDTSLLRVLLFQIFSEWWKRKPSRHQPRWFSCPSRDEYRTKFNELVNKFKLVEIPPHASDFHCSILE